MPASRQSAARSAPTKPWVMRGEVVEVDVVARAACRACGSEDLAAAGVSGTPIVDLAVEAAGAAQRRVERSGRFVAPMTITWPRARPSIRPAAAATTRFSTSPATSARLGAMASISSMKMMLGVEEAGPNSPASSSSTRSTPSRPSAAEVVGRGREARRRPAAHADGRPGSARPGDRHRRHQPARRARSGAAPSRPLRPRDRHARRPTRRARARSSRIHSRGMPLARRRRPGRAGRDHARASSAPTWPRSAARRRWRRCAGPAPAPTSPSGTHPRSRSSSR